MKKTALKTILFGLTQALRFSALRSPAMRSFMARRNCIAQIRLKDGSVGRYYVIDNGRISSQAGVHPKPDVAMVFRDLPTAFTFMVPPANQLDIVNAAKTFKVVVEGRDELVVWFMQLLNMILSAGVKYGTEMKDGSTRYTTNTNGGPLFVYVKDGRILRTTPIDLDDRDAPSWTIHARGRRFTPRRQATVSPHALTLK